MALGLRVRREREYTRGWKVDSGSKQVKASPGVSSEVYACDEQHLKILGEEMFHRAVVDSAGEIMAGEVTTHMASRQVS